MSDTTITDHDDIFTGDSGHTSPEDGNTIFTGHRRSPSIETAITQIGSVASSEGSIQYPGAPVNSPEPSIAGDSVTRQTPALDTNSLAERLQAMPLTPPSSVGSSGTNHEGKHPLKAISKCNLPLKQLLYKSPPSRSKDDKRSGISLAEHGAQEKAHSKLDYMERAYNETGKDSTFEHTIWAELAEEDVTHSLARLAMVAKDEEKKDKLGKLASDYYSARLARLLKAGEIQFNTSFMDKE